ncbi:MAG: ClpXP protease specificity-enhancing factor SspB [Rhodovibrionaceae bacterium]
MSDDSLRYDLMVEDALRGVVKAALKEAAQGGLSGEHHFYITFKTGHAGVDIPQTLRERYPDEMTIVLQHQFWDLIVEEERFSVTLSFDGKADPLRIPFDSVVAFADPSVKFGLQFGQDGELEGVDDSGMEENEEARAEEERAGPEQSSAPQALPKPAAGEKNSDSETQDNQRSPSSEDSDKVVALDRFRKKPADR